MRAALAEFSRHGLRGARIEDITQACGLSKGAFYLHFESKEALLAEASSALQANFERLVAERRAERSRLLEEVGPRVVANPDLLERFQAVDAHHDRLTLEAMWEHRQVLDVLLRGAQGTELEGVMWSYVDAEMRRVADDIEQAKAVGLCLPNMPSEVVGAMVLGTWLMLARLMVELPEKPDVEFWVQSLKRLINQGMAPVSEQRPARRSAPARRRAPARPSKLQRRRR